MAYFWMIVCVITCTIQSPFKKIYQSKTSKGTFLFTAMIQLASACFFAGACLFGGGFSYEWGVLPFSLAFAAAVSCCGLTSVVSLRYGPLALTSLFSSYSLMLPTLYGFVRFKDTIYVSQLIGIAITITFLISVLLGIFAILHQFNEFIEKVCAIICSSRSTLWVVLYSCQ